MSVELCFEMMEDYPPSIAASKKLDNALPEEFTYDYTTADETYYAKRRVAKWMQFPDSEFVNLNESPAIAHPPAEVVRELVGALQAFTNAWSDCLGFPQTDSERFQLSEARDKAEAALKSAKEHDL